MTGIEFITNVETLLADVHTLKVLLFALYGWAFAVTFFVARRENKNTSRSP
jgi:hypothetical protein